MRQVGDEMALAVEHLRADGHAQLDVVAVRAVLAGTTPGAAAACRVLPLDRKREIAQVWVGDEHDVTAGAAVTAVRPSTRYVLLAPEAERAVSTTPGTAR